MWKKWLCELFSDQMVIFWSNLIVFTLFFCVKCFFLNLLICNCTFGSGFDNIKQILEVYVQSLDIFVISPFQTLLRQLFLFPFLVSGVNFSLKLVFMLVWFFGFFHFVIINFGWLWIRRIAWIKFFCWISLFLIFLALFFFFVPCSIFLMLFNCVIMGFLKVIVNKWKQLKGW